MGSPSPRLGGGQAPSTKSYEYTVKGLQNGQEYEFTVIASANKYSNNAASSTVRATPKSPSPPPSPVFQLCSQYIYPNGPANLRTTSVGKTEVGLCWDPPSSNGCVDSYDLKIEPVDPGMLRTTASAPIRVQSTRCYTVKDLSPGTKYRATVTVSSLVVAHVWQRLWPEWS